MSFVLPDETHCVRGMIAELGSTGICLTPWEQRFLNTLLAWEGNFTQRQSETAVRIWGKYIKTSQKNPERR